MYIADLHIHSRYSRATSKDCTPEYLDLWARRKGISIVGTGDFTHPAWRQELEEKLARTLSGIHGAGETEVMLTLKSGSRQVLAQDTQSRGEGERSVSTVTLGRGSGSQEVVPLQTVAPQFRGALVVCAGGDDPGVRLQVIRAGSALTGLGSDCITVCQGDP